MPHAATSRVDPGRAPATGWRDALAFSPLIPASLAFALTALVGHALDPAADAGARLRLAILAASGCTIVYALDRLRDRERDRTTSPRRTAFVEQHRRALAATTVAAAVAGGVCLTMAEPAVVLLCGGIGGLGLLHRRLKRFAAGKTLYVSLAWTGVCVGLPWLGLSPATTGQGVPDDAATASAIALAAILLPCFAANLLASNLRDDEASWLGDRPGRLIAIAAVIAATGLGVALLAPEPVRAFGWVPAALLLALAGYRPTELYGHLAVDGSLLVGALATALHLGGG